MAIATRSSLVVSCFILNVGQVVKLANTYGSGPYAVRLEGSTPSLPTQRLVFSISYGVS